MGGHKLGVQLDPVWFSFDFGLEFVLIRSSIWILVFICKKTHNTLIKIFFFLRKIRT